MAASARRAGSAAASARASNAASRAVARLRDVLEVRGPTGTLLGLTVLARVEAPSPAR
jgi:hypothetical protein